MTTTTATTLGFPAAAMEMLAAYLAARVRAGMMTAEEAAAHVAAFHATVKE